MRQHFLRSTLESVSTRECSRSCPVREGGSGHHPPPGGAAGTSLALLLALALLPCHLPSVAPSSARSRSRMGRRGCWAALLLLAAALSGTCAELNGKGNTEKNILPAWKTACGHSLASHTGRAASPCRRSGAGKAQAPIGRSARVAGPPQPPLPPPPPPPGRLRAHRIHATPPQCPTLHPC